MVEEIKIFNIYNINYEIRIIKEDNIVLYNLKDISKMILHSNSRDSIINKLDRVKRECKTAGGKQQMIFVTENGLKIFISKSRKPRAAELAKYLGMNINDIYTHCFESSTLQSIIYVFKNEKFKAQYSIDKYFIDLYFIDYKIAIECDESKHKLTKENDKIRQNYIESKLYCKFIRYNPEEKDFNIFVVINKIFEQIKISLIK